MALLSILTATFPPKNDHLVEAAESVAGLSIPRGWELEWLVQEDAAMPSPAALEAAALVKFSSYECNGSHLGVATTRNLALRRARGEWVRILDHDDLLTPDCALRIAESIDANPGVGWISHQAEDLLPDGTLEGFPPDMAFGVVEPGEVNRRADEIGRFPIHCAGLTLEVSSVRALGGWVATPRSEDVAMFAALSDRRPGLLAPESTWLYRKWPGQTRREAWWIENGDAAGEIISQRRQALRASEAFGPCE